PTAASAVRLDGDGCGGGVTGRRTCAGGGGGPALAGAAAGRVARAGLGVASIAGGGGGTPREASTGRFFSGTGTADGAGGAAASGKASMPRSKACSSSSGVSSL